MVGRMGRRLQVQPMLEGLWFGRGDSSEEDGSHQILDVCSFS